MLQWHEAKASRDSDKAKWRTHAFTEWDEAEAHLSLILHRKRGILLGDDSQRMHHSPTAGHSEAKNECTLLRSRGIKSKAISVLPETPSVWHHSRFALRQRLHILVWRLEGSG